MAFFRSRSPFGDGDSLLMKKNNFFGSEPEDDYKNDKDEKFTSFLARQWMKKKLKTEPQKYTQYLPLTISIGTWNVDSAVESNFDIVKNWLQTNLNSSLYVVGLQEVDMSATALIKEETNVHAKWNNVFSNIFSKDYTILISKQLVGLYLIIVVKKSLMKYVQDVKIGSLNCGILGYFGNKGAIGVAFKLSNNSFCFVNSHLAPHQDSVEKRNQNHLLILNELEFSESFNMDWRHRPSIFDFNNIEGSPDEDWTDDSSVLNSSLLKNDFVFWLGDLNYRIDLPYEKTIEIIKDNKELELLKHDQLNKERKMEKIFVGFNEGEILFKPTYKFNKKTHGYDNEKKRIPAYTDRVLFMNNKLKKKNSQELFKDIVSKNKIIKGRKRRRSTLKNKIIINFSAKESKKLKAPTIPLPSLKDYLKTKQIEKENENEKGKEEGEDQKVKKEEFVEREKEKEVEVIDLSETSKEETKMVIKSEERNLHEEIDVEKLNKIDLVYYNSYEKPICSDHKPVIARFKMLLRVNKMDKLRRDLLKFMDETANERIPKVNVDTQELVFNDLRYGIEDTQVVKVKNIGKSTCEYDMLYFITEDVGKLRDEDLRIKDWIRLYPKRGIVLAGEEAEIRVSINIKKHSNFLNKRKNFEHIFVLRLKHGRDFFICLKGTYLPSPFGVSLNQLVDIKSGIEIPTLTTTVVDYLYKFAMQEQYLFLKNGKNSEKKLIRMILEKSNCKSLDGYNGSVHSVAAILMQFLSSFVEPLIPEKLNEKCSQMGISGKFDGKKIFESLGKQMRIENMYLFHYIVVFLKDLLLEKNQKMNRLSSATLSVIFVRILFRNYINKENVYSKEGMESGLLEFIMKCLK